MCKNDVITCAHHDFVENTWATGQRTAFSVSKISHSDAVPVTWGPGRCPSLIDAAQNVNVHRHASRCFALTRWCQRLFNLQQQAAVLSMYIIHFQRYQFQLNAGSDLLAIEFDRCRQLSPPSFVFLFLKLANRSALSQCGRNL